MDAILTLALYAFAVCWLTYAVADLADAAVRLARTPNRSE